MIHGKVILSEIKRRLRKYDKMNLIKDEVVYDHIIKALKPFGSNVMQLQDKLIHVRGGVAKGPKGIWSLTAAFLCEPKGYVIKKGHEDNLQNTFFWREISKSGTRWDNCRECCEESYQEVITESIYFNDLHVDFHYHNPIPLRPSRTIKRDQCSEKFRKFLRFDSPYEISLNEETITTNFSEGAVYLRFYGVVLDDEGIPSVPIMQHEKLETYILYYTQWKLMEEWWLNGDVDNIQTKIQYLQSQVLDSKELASVEAKFSTLTPQSLRKIKIQNRLESYKYECMFPTLNDYYYNYTHYSH